MALTLQDLFYIFGIVTFILFSINSVYQSIMMREARKRQEDLSNIMDETLNELAEERKGVFDKLVLKKETDNDDSEI